MGGVMSDATVDVPAVGRVKKTYVIAGGALVAGIAGYAWWRASAANAAGADIPAYTEEDIADGVTDTSGGAAGGSANSGGSASDSSTTPDTDPEWVQQATEALSGSYDSAALAIALGRYITHVSLSPVQADMVRAAIGIVGYPPGGHYELITTVTPTPSALTEPKNVHVVSKDATSVTLGWTAVPGADYYRAYRSGASTNVGATDAGHTTIRITGLKPGTEYSFQVAADTTKARPGPKSTPIKVRTSATAFKPVTGVKISSVTTTTAQVSWTRQKGADYYRIYINNVAHGSADGGLSSYKVQGLKRGTAYAVTVAADTTNQKPGPKSNPVRFTTKK